MRVRHSTLSVLWIAGVATLLLTNVSDIFAGQKAAVYMYGAGAECTCALGVIFPGKITTGYGTGGWDANHANDPAGWAPYEDEDRLWVKTKCEKGPDADDTPVPEVLVPEAWDLDLTQTEAPEGHEEWETDPPGDPAAGTWPGAGAHCPCSLLIKWTCSTGNPAHNGVSYHQCYKDWTSITHIAGNSPAGSTVTITVRLVCGDCVLELSDTATMFASP